MPSFADLHLTPPLAAALDRLGWNPDDPSVRETIPTVARGNNLVAATPPAPVYAVPALAGVLARTGPGARTLVLAPAGQLDEFGRMAHSLTQEYRHASPGCARNRPSYAAAEIRRCGSCHHHT